MNNHEKLIEKAIKLLGVEQANEIRSFSEDQLRNLIVNASREIADAKAELEANSKYQEILEQKKAMSAGFGDLKKLLNVKIQLAINSLNEKGK